jgi:hypothetical protein
MTSLMQIYINAVINEIYINAVINPVINALIMAVINDEQALQSYSIKDLKCVVGVVIIVVLVVVVIVVVVVVVHTY